MTEEIADYVDQNRELITKVLAHGTPEARGWALALIQNGASVEDIESIQDRLDELKREAAT